MVLFVKFKFCMGRSRFCFFWNLVIESHKLHSNNILIIECLPQNIDQWAGFTTTNVAANVLPRILSHQMTSWRHISTLRGVVFMYRSGPFFTKKTLSICFLSRDNKSQHITIKKITFHIMQSNQLQISLTLWIMSSGIKINTILCELNNTTTLSE